MAQQLRVWSHERTSKLVNQLPNGSYNTFWYLNRKLDCHNEKDCFVLTKNNAILKCLNFYKSELSVVIIGQPVEGLDDFFIRPINSRKLNIYKTSRRFNNILMHTNATELYCKLIKFETSELSDSCIFYPFNKFEQHWRLDLHGKLKLSKSKCFQTLF